MIDQALPTRPTDLPALWPETLRAGAILALATVAFFWQILLTPQAWMPAGGGDLVPFLYPNYVFAARNLSRGIIPLWNPHLYGGVPFAADPQSGLFYPLNLIVFLLHPNLTVETLEHLAVFHFWLAGFGMFLFLRHSPLARRLNLQPIPALAGALAFEFSDLFIVHFGNLNMIAVAAWLPLVVLTFQKAITARQVNWALAAGVLLGVATLAGHIQVTLFILLALALYTVWQIFLPGEIQGSLAQPTAFKPVKLELWRVPSQMLLLTLLVTIGLSSLWLIPTLEMSRQTLRTGLSYSEAAAYALNPPQLIGLLVPNYFGRDPALHWGPWDRVETGYIGILPLLLAVVALVLERSRSSRFLALLALVSLLLAVGDNSVLHGWLSLSPGFGQFRAPARYILLLDFALAALAAIGLQGLMRPLTGRQKVDLNMVLKTLTWVLGGLTVIGLPLAYYALLVTQDRNVEIFRRAQAAATGVTTFAILITADLMLLHLARLDRLRSTALGIGATLLIAVDLFSLGANVDVGYQDPTAGFDHPAALAFLRQDSNINRIEVTTDVWHLWQPDTALLDGLYDAWGVYNPLTLADPTRFWQEIGPRSSRRYNFLGVKYIVASKAGAPADGQIVPIFDADPAINIYLNLEALPRLLFVPQAIVVESHEAAWQAVQAPTFDPTQAVVLEQLDQAAPPANPPGSQLPAATISLVQYDLHTVRVDLRSEFSGYLVLSDAYYPGWRAEIDGELAPLYRANYAFRAVPVPAGSHTVRFSFEPFSWKIGLLLSGVTLVGLAGAVGRYFYRKR